MQYRQYGHTGIQVSVLGFGAGRFAVAKRHFDEDRYVALMQRAFELGVNYVDTGDVYSFGRSEVAVGKAIRGRGQKVYVATKMWYRGDSASEASRRLERSLQRLGVACIDFYHLHDLHWSHYRKQSAPDGVIDRLRRARDEGLIRHLCFSSHDTPQNIRQLIDAGQFAGMLVQYNLLDRSNEGVIAYAHSKGMGVAVMGPVAGGALAAPSQRIQGMVAGARSTPEVALRFVLSNPNVTLTLSGMTDMDMVQQNAAIASRGEPLSPREQQQVLAALHETQALLDLYCTACGYCMPCPNGVDIPRNFEAMNFHRVWGLTAHARHLYQRLGRPRKRRDGTVVRKWAAACLECGECEPKCPQGIPIRERLKQTAAALNVEQGLVPVF